MAKPVTRYAAMCAKSGPMQSFPALPIWRWLAARAVALSSPAVWRGICQKFLTDKETIDRFAAVWPQGDFLQHIPIRLLVNPLAPLVGAAAHYLQSENSMAAGDDYFYADRQYWPRKYAIL